MQPRKTDIHAGGVIPAVSTGSLYDLDIPTEEAVSVLAGLGVRSMEVFLQCEPELGETFIAELANRCTGLQVRINSVHPYVFGFENLLFSGYRRQRIWAFKRYERYLSICATLGAGFYVAHGPPRHLVTEGKEMSANYMRTTCELAALARQHGVQYVLENVSYGLIRTVEDALDHVDRFADQVPLVLDFKSAWKVGQEPSAFAEAVGQQIAFAHVSFRDPQNATYGLCARPDENEPELATTFRTLTQVRSPQADHVVEVFWPNSLADVERSIAVVTEALQSDLAPQIKTQLTKRLHEE